MKAASIARALVVLGALLTLGSVNFAIVTKEGIRRDGAVVYLPLAPVDPRSLLQGDYMALRFALTTEIERAALPDSLPRGGETGFVDVAIDAQRITRIAPADAPPALRLRYRMRNGRIWLGTNAFLFEEGSAERFSSARYGEFRVDRASGEPVLVGLRDAALKAL